jgi:type II restriction enzyme
MRKTTIDLIFKLAKEKNAFLELEKQIETVSKKKLGENLIECGILPEVFNQNSSEEKVWAKFSDIILSRALNFLDIETIVLGARGNSADVYGKTNEYTLVGDAKTFRLSRTAKNQKDFKIDALDNWKGENNYSILVSPLVQYPNSKSQIYSQAIEKNVTLLSYTHLHFLLDFHNKQSLKPIWETGKLLSKTPKINHQSSEYYWKAIDEIFVDVVGKRLDDLKEYKILEIEKTKNIGQEGINYWKDRIENFKKLSKEEAIKLLLKSEKIEAKIKTIEKAINVKKI